MTPWTIAHQTPLWDSPGKNTGVGCHALLQRIFPTQGLNPSLPVAPTLQADSLPLSHLGRPNQDKFWCFRGLHISSLKDQAIQILHDRVPAALSTSVGRGQTETSEPHGPSNPLDHPSVPHTLHCPPQTVPGK